MRVPAAGNVNRGYSSIQVNPCLPMCSERATQNTANDVPPPMPCTGVRGPGVLAETADSIYQCEPVGLPPPSSVTDMMTITVYSLWARGVTHEACGLIQ